MRTVEEKPLRNITALVGQENAQLRLGTSISNLMVHLPSEVILENNPKEKWEIRGQLPVRVSVRDMWVKWRYDDAVNERLAEGCLVDFVRQRESSDQGIADFVRRWGPLALGGEVADRGWCRERLHYWRGAARSAYALLCLSQELRGKGGQGKGEKSLADLWRQVPFKPNDQHFTSGLPNHVSTPEGVHVARFSSTLDPSTISRMSIDYQKALLASYISHWLAFAQASPQVAWIGDHPALTFSKIIPEKLNNADEMVLSDWRDAEKKKNAVKMGARVFETRSFSVGSLPDSRIAEVSVELNHQKEYLSKTVPAKTSSSDHVIWETWREDMDLPTVTFLAIALQLAAAVLGDANVFVCVNCSEVSTSVKAHGPGRPVKYCSPRCGEEAKVIQRRNARMEKRQQGIVTKG